MDGAREGGAEDHAGRGEVMLGGPHQKLEKVGRKERFPLQDPGNRSNPFHPRSVGESRHVADVAPAAQRNADPLAGTDDVAEFLRD